MPKGVYERLRAIVQRYAAGGVLQRELAAEFGVHASHVSRITSGYRRNV